MLISSLYDQNGSNFSKSETKNFRGFIRKVIGIVYLREMIADGGEKLFPRVQKTEQQGKYFFCLMANDLIKSNNNKNSSWIAPTGWHVQ